MKKKLKQQVFGQKKKWTIFQKLEDTSAGSSLWKEEEHIFFRSRRSKTLDIKCAAWKENSETKALIKVFSLLMPHDGI